jgi:mono/diheme cytochrome c family protein
MSRTMTFALASVALAVAGGLALWRADAGEQAPGQILMWQDAGVVALGAEVYAVNCAACHGADLEGQPDWQVALPDGRLPAPPHDETGHTWHHPDRLLIDITTRGTAAVVGGGYESDMIGFGDVLTEAEIVAALSYIKSTWPERVIRFHDEINARDAMEDGR